VQLGVVNVQVKPLLVEQLPETMVQLPFLQWFHLLVHCFQLLRPPLLMPSGFKLSLNQ
jgi:hypothetical protein